MLSLPPFRIWAAALALLLVAAPARAQTPGVTAEGSADLTRVDEATTVRSVGYTFTDTQTFGAADFALVVATTEPGFLETGIGGRIASALSFLPIFEEPGVYPFSPVTLLLDTRRLESFYARNGFLRSRVGYRVFLDSAANVVDLTFVIKEGRSLRIDEIRYVGPDGAPAVGQFPDAETAVDWARARDDAPVGEGDRLGQLARLQIRDLALGFARNNGYAFATVRDTVVVDTLANVAVVTDTLRLGPRTVFGEILVEGAESVNASVIRRELPFRTGEPFEADLLVEAQRELFALNLFQTALVSLVRPCDALDAAGASAPERGPCQPVDGTADVRVRIREGPARLVTATPGFDTEAGLRTQIEWTHRNFFGGARTFRAGLDARTGILSTAPTGLSEVLYRAQVSLQQPYFLNRHTSLTAAPYAQYRDDFVERSTEGGLETTAVYERGRLANGSLQLAYSYRNVIEVRDPSQLGLAGLTQNPAALTQGFRVNRTLVRLAGTLGQVDSPLNPRRGFIVRPTASVTVPGLSNVLYLRGGLTAQAFYPFTDAVGLQGRVTAGRLLPFGATGDAPDAQFARYRDAAFFAGGTGDVRGWGTGQAGPRYPAYRFREIPLVVPGNPVASLPVASFPAGAGYLPVGGRTKLSASAQLNLPFPGLGPQWGTLVFFDAGGVSDTPVDDVPAVTLDPDLDAFLQILRDQERGLRYGVGAGVQFQSAFGPVSFSVGYKLNPSFLDLRDPALVYLALDPNNTLYPTVFPDATAPFALQIPFSEIPEEGFRRLGFHITIGQTF